MIVDYVLFLCSLSEFHSQYEPMDFQSIVVEFFEKFISKYSLF